jgi:hypothetical protein
MEKNTLVIAPLLILFRVIGMQIKITEEDNNATYSHINNNVLIAFCCKAETTLLPSIVNISLPFYEKKSPTIQGDIFHFSQESVRLHEQFKSIKR